MAITLVVLGIMAWNSIIWPRDLSNGSIDFSFKPANNWTQFVIWLDDANGEYVGTVFLTSFIGRRGGGNRTRDTNIDSQNGNRLSALPIWAHQRGVIDTTFGIKNYYPPAATKSAYPADIDAVSGATPNQSFQTKSWQFAGLPDGEYKCWIEVNRSYDFNEFHQYSFYRGQPSLVWKTTIEVRQSADSSQVLDYLGYGAPGGADGEISPPDSTITTAVDLLSDLGGYKFKVVYTPNSACIKDCSPSDNFFILEQNFPNPFNAGTTIRYFLPKSCQVNLSIYNILGQKVAILVDELQTAGCQTVGWDGRNFNGEDLDSGIYFYKIRTGEFSGTRMLVFLK